MLSKDEYFMFKALKLASISAKKGEVPVGAVLVMNDRIIASGHNSKESKNCAVFHAETICIMKASQKIKNWRLLNCELYITLEPCLMCVGAILSSRIKRIIFGTKNEEFGYCVSNKIHGIQKQLPEYRFGVLEQKCSSIISDFFINLR